MAAVYDDLAEQFQLFRAEKSYRIMEYTFLHYLGDVSGKSILDLACGEGSSARKLKQMGAKHLVGVDISQKMLKLALKHEAQDPLGTEYLHSPVQELGKIGNFDVVIAIFLLHYASTKEQLLKMCQTAYDNLKPGNRFIAANNVLTPKGSDLPAAYEKYNIGSIKFSKPLQDGSAMNITLTAGDEKLQFDNYFYSKETYEWALRTAGFRSINWHRLILPPEIEREDGREFWEFFLETYQIIVIECQK